jgi:hypothetical protein
MMGSVVYFIALVLIKLHRSFNMRVISRHFSLLVLLALDVEKRQPPISRRNPLLVSP